MPSAYQSPYMVSPSEASLWLSWVLVSLEDQGIKIVFYHHYSVMQLLSQLRSMRRKTLFGAGHVHTLDKHFPTGVETSLYFEPQLGGSVIVREGI